jgi:hypothetical protein
VCREALKWRISVAGGVEWENLPLLLACIFQEIDKRKCGGSEITDAGRAGKASGMKQNAAGAWKSHAEPKFRVVGHGQDKSPIRNSDDPVLPV